MPNSPAPNTALARSEPDSALQERIARILQPQAWAALGVGDTLTYKNRRTSSLRKAAAILVALPNRNVLIEEVASELETSYPDHAWLNAACACVRSLKTRGDA